MLWISLLPVMPLVSLSAYLRLSHPGVGCPDWPACCGKIGESEIVSQPLSTENALYNLYRLSVDGDCIYFDFYLYLFKTGF